jgi:hypothetical protein
MEVKKTNKKQSKGSVMKRLISGTYISETLILNNIRYVILVFILAIIYISNRFQAERIERETLVLEQEVRDLRAESLSTSAQLMTMSRQTEVFKMVRDKGLGLQELHEPPYRIVVNE